MGLLPPYQRTVMHDLKTTLGLKLVLLLMFALWVVSLAGVISTCNMARKGELAPTHPTFKDNTGRPAPIDKHLQAFPTPDSHPSGYAQNIPSMSYAVGIHFSYDFWIVFFHGFVLILSYMAITTERVHNKFQLCFCYGISIFNFTILASVYTKLTYSFGYPGQFKAGSGRDYDDKAANSVAVAAAGCIGVLIVSFAWLALFSTEEKGQPTPTGFGCVVPPKGEDDDDQNDDE